ncbi:hypothetical protein Tco_1352832 [Tanacetum coccineum]
MTSMVELESLFGHLFDELSNGENQVVSKSSDVTTADAFDKRQQQQDSTSSTSSLATTISADGNFDLHVIECSSNGFRFVQGNISKTDQLLVSGSYKGVKLGVKVRKGIVRLEDGTMLGIKTPQGTIMKSAVSTEGVENEKNCKIKVIKKMPSYNLSINRGQCIIYRYSQRMIRYEDIIMDPGMQCTTLLSPLNLLKKIAVFISARRSSHFPSLLRSRSLILKGAVAPASDYQITNVHFIESRSQRRSSKSH